MGAWDATSFGNDTANDWAFDLEDYDDLSYVIDTLQTVIDTGDEDLDSGEACEAIAAAEVIAWLRGKPTPTDAYTEKLAKWVAAHPLKPPANVVQLALDALDRIETEPSELSELWEDSEEWTAAMDDLRARLSA